MGKALPVISLVVGFIAGLAISPSGSESETGRLENLPGSIAAVECVCDMRSTDDVERELEAARSENEKLRDRVSQLTAELERSNRQETAWIPGQSWLDAAREDLMAGIETVDRKQQLVDAGFAPARAASLADRERELQLAAMRDADNAYPMGALEVRMAARRALRRELGDFEYEQYLEATGQSTAVAVTQVLQDSQAASAGLQVGDEILDYDGVRVFNIIELADLAREGSADEVVIVNIERGGSPMQLVLPRGPLGISGGLPGRP